MKLITIFLLLFSFLIVSCKKKVSETTLVGEVYSGIEGEFVNGANVKFFIRSLANNSFSNNFKLEDELNVASDGKFSFSFLKTSSDVEYKLAISNAGYRFKEVVINPSSIVAGEGNELDQNLIPVGVVSFHISSGSNSNNTDEFLFNFNNELEGGESFVNRLWLGNQVDTVLSAELIAERYNKFTYILKRNGMYLTVGDSVFCSKGNSIQKNIVY
jgi:hypothetical protein